MIRKTVKVGDRDLIIETGRMAKQADGAVVVRQGDTMLLATCVSAREKKDIDFLPLTVEYKETFAAAGRIPGGYFRREGRLTEKETLTSRIVDRSCRPLFPDTASDCRRTGLLDGLIRARKGSGRVGGARDDA
jgi:polyribonucleotide nucleotidyltransferase